MRTGFLEKLPEDPVEPKRRPRELYRPSVEGMLNMYLSRMKPSGKPELFLNIKEVSLLVQLQRR